VVRGSTNGQHRAAASNFSRSTNETSIVAAADLPINFRHDLRHTGNQLADASGATTQELMHRMGYGAMQAALRGQCSLFVSDRHASPTSHGMETA
jgi:hypothetical protein